MTSLRPTNNLGFSVIEILMALILLAVLAAIALNAFVNFKTEARDAALRADLKILRTAIGAQYGQMQLRCNTNPGTFPPLVNINANNITNAATPCTTVQVATASERKFVQGSIPIPPHGTINTVLACAAGSGCNRTGDCINGAASYSNQWCYNVLTGEIWADTASYISY